MDTNISGRLSDIGMTLGSLKGSARWCSWRSEVRKAGGDPTKVPYASNNQRVRIFEDLLVYDRVGLVASNIGAASNVGVYLGPIEGQPYVLCGVDLDQCRDENGVMAAWAALLVGILKGAYVEVSPSGCGVKLYILVETTALESVREALGIVGNAHGRVWKGKAVGGEKAPGIEAYLGRRWFAVTSDAVALDAAQLGVMGPEEAAAVAAIGAGHFGGGKDAGRLTEADATMYEPVVFGEVTEADGRLISEAIGFGGAFARLWAGDTAALGGSDRTDSALAFAIGGELRALGLGRAAAASIMRDGCAALAGWSDKHMGLGDFPREFARIWAKKSGMAGGGPGPVELEPLTEAESKNMSEAMPSTTIQLRPGIAELVSLAETAVEHSNHPDTEIYQSGGRLVRPYHFSAHTFGGKTTRIAAFDELTKSSAIDVLSKAANWTRWDSKLKRVVEADPTDKIAEVWLSRRGLWQARTVRGILTCPTIRPDGSVIWQAGYDPATQLYLDLDPDLVMPADILWRSDRISRDDALAAMSLIDALLVGFPFVSDADKSVALSGIITPVIKGALDKRPLHAYDAANAGTGKTYLTEVSTAAALGRPAPVSSFSPKNDAENENRVAALLMSGTPVGVIDNVNGLLGGDLLCQACTSQAMSIRIFHTQKNMLIDNNLCLYATGNNITLYGDLVRRALLARLDAGMEHPERRKFKTDPLLTVQQNRGKYLAAILIIVRAHAQSGFMGFKGIEEGDFQAWNKFVRGALRWLGKADPVATTDRAYEEDPERMDQRAFMAAWVACFGGRAVSVREAVDTSGADANGRAFIEAALRVSGKNDKIDTVKLGMWLRSVQRRVIGNQRFIQPDGNSSRWQITNVTWE